MSVKNYIVGPGPAISLDNGGSAGAEEAVRLDPELPHNRRLLESGRLIENPTQSKRKNTKENS